MLFRDGTVMPLFPRCFSKTYRKKLAKHGLLREYSMPVKEPYELGMIGNGGCPQPGETMFAKVRSLCFCPLSDDYVSHELTENGFPLAIYTPSDVETVDVLVMGSTGPTILEDVQVSDVFNKIGFTGTQLRVSVVDEDTYGRDVQYRSVWNATPNVITGLRTRTEVTTIVADETFVIPESQHGITMAESADPNAFADLLYNFASRYIFPAIDERVPRDGRNGVPVREGIVITFHKEDGSPAGRFGGRFEITSGLIMMYTDAIKTPLYIEYSRNVNGYLFV
jgi:hypothetical protein